jgi:hypothetical protein
MLNVISTQSSTSVHSNVNKFLTCYYTNCDGILNKRHELEATIELHSPDIICVTEFIPKSLKTPLHAAELQVQGYDTFMNDPQAKRGVLVYVSNHLRATQLDMTPTVTSEESTWIEIKLKGKDKLLLGCVYRSPNSTAENNDRLLEDIRKISLGTSFSHILICGDFNLPEINWSDTSTLGGPNSLPYRFIECIRDSFLTQHVKIPTHKRGDQRANVLDLVFTNEEDMIDEITPLDPWGKSHHCGLIYKFKCYADQARPRWTLNFNKADYDEMRRIMGGYSWDDDLRDLTCDEAWEIFATRLNESMLKCIPKRKIGMKSTKPTWITKIAIEKAKNKKRAYQKYLQTRNEDDYKLCKSQKPI